MVADLAQRHTQGVSGYGILEPKPGFQFSLILCSESVDILKQRGMEG